MATTDSEFADYLSMESFFNAETMSQQNFSAAAAAAAAAAASQQNGEYLMAPMDQSGANPGYNYEANMSNEDKFEFHNNNTVQYFYENNNSVQQQILQQQPAEYYVRQFLTRLLEIQTISFLAREVLLTLLVVF